MALTRSIPVVGVLGTTPIAPVLITQGLTVVTVAIDGSQLIDPSLVFTVQIDFSPDGGTTWASSSPGPTMDPFPISFTIQGRASHPGSKWVSRPLVDGLNRLVRGTIINNSPSPLNTTATISAV